MKLSQCAKVLFRFGLVFVIVEFIVIHVASASVSAANIGCIVDDFTSSLLNPAWSIVDPLGGSVFDLTESPGVLRIRAINGNRDLASFNQNAPRLMRLISGDFDIQTKVTINPKAGYQSAGLVMWINNANFVWIGRSPDGVIGHNYLRNGSNEGLNPDQPFFPSTTVYFKVIRQSNTFSTFFSDTGISWTKTGSIDYSAAPTSVSAGIFLLNNWTETSIQADFDFFRMNCTSNLIHLPFVNKPLIPAQMEKKVFALAYIDAVPLNDPDIHQREFIAGLRRGSIWHGYNNPNGTPAVGYTTYGGSVIRVNEAPPHRTDTGQFNYQEVYQRYDLCTKIQQGLADEVWIWESGTGNAWEWVTNGPNWSWTMGSNVPNCGKTVTTLNLNYQREIDVAYESYVHRLEGTMMTNNPCVFYTNTWPWINWPGECQGLVSDLFGFVARPFAGNDFIAVCGDAHHPPNITDNREYIYDDPANVNSICKDWQWNGSGQVSTFNCNEWGCTHKGFHIWWMQNIPGLSNNNRDRNGNLMPNWWEYLFN